MVSLIATWAVFSGCSGTTSSSQTCAEIECGDFGRCSGELDGGPACVCDTGYTGEDCSECDDGYAREGGECVPAESGLGGTCADDPCGGNGDCDETGGIVTCECDEGYAGEDCSECADGYHEEGGGCLVDQLCGADSCPPNSTCDDRGGIITCACDEGYVGEDCTCAAGYHDEGGECVRDENCMGSTCNSAGTCADESGTPTCECDEGYTGEHCDECAAGYHEEAGQCLPDQECGDDSCPANATCDDSSGIVTCVCNDGYAGDDCSECADGLVLNPAGECVEPCEEGFEFGSTGECEAVIPECEDGYQLIDLSQVDVSTIDPELLPGGELPPSGFICIPIEMAITCQDIDPCSTHGTCDDSGDELVCVCDVGYAGLTCSDCAAGYHPEGDECLIDESCLPATCNSRGTCDDSSGSVECSCEPGYTGPNCDQCADGYHMDDAGACVADEVCSAATCNGGGACRIVEGLAVCACFEGYIGEFCDECDGGFHEEDGLCRPDEVCGPNTCSGVGTCEDDTGVPVCTCNEGYTGDACQECAVDYTRSDGDCVLIVAENECGPDPCSNRGTCDDSTGEAVCDCEPPYTGVICQSCIPGYVKWPDGICRISVCGDGIRDWRTEQCDDSTLEQEDCEYGFTSCEVCGGTNPNPAPPPVVVGPGNVLQAAQVRGERSLYAPETHCQVVPGVTHYCGDFTPDDPEEVDGSEEECDLGDVDNYGENDGAYEGCNADCTFAPHCGDGVDEEEGEACDDGRPEGCDRVQLYGEIDFVGESCDSGNNDGCLNTCETNVCGDTYINEVEDAETCESSVECVDEPLLCEFTPNYPCTPECQDNVCGDGYLYDPSYDDVITRGIEYYEECDFGDENVETAVDCEYTLAQNNCSLCNTDCGEIPGIPNYCGDGDLDDGDGEACDEGDAANVDPSVPAELRCPLYGENCSLCSTACADTAGTPRTCGDGFFDPPDEECENGVDETNCYVDEDCISCSCEIVVPSK